MPLSDHEQRLLEQMERALYAEDPKFATSLRSPAERRGARRRSTLAVAGALVGAAGLVAGVAWSQVIVGVAGFLLMLAGTFLLVTVFTTRPALPSADAGKGGATPGPAPAKAQGTGFMDRVEERWRKRHDGESTDS
jgi:hypothetical protein